jgi:peptidyl-prolyl cis-trans isomerase A (cyclophilin A)
MWTISQLEITMETANQRAALRFLIGDSFGTERLTMHLGNFRAACWSLCLILSTIVLGAASAEAAVVRFVTSRGNITARLYDDITPISVVNFKNYANANRWDGTFIHRSVPGFIVQGGGFSLTPDIFHTTNVTTFPAVQNEYKLSNLRGTIAYAKLGGDPNSATSQWFFNLANNSANLDNQNGGFTVFGRVVGNGMTIVDNIAASSRINAGGAFTDVPVNDIDQVLEQQNIFNADAVVISDVAILNLPAGDYNFDGAVNQADLLIWQADYGSSIKADADGNGDGRVDGRDFLIWQRTLGQTSPLGAFAAVPEPSAICLFAAGVMASTGLRRRR